MTDKKPATKKAPAKAVAKKLAAEKPAPKKPAAKPAPKTESLKTSHAHPVTHTGKYFFATGRRKNAVAVVRLFANNNGHTVNRKGLGSYFNQPYMQTMALEPLRLTGKENEVSFYATVSGGGLKAQAEAVRHGVARALVVMDQELKRILKQNGFLTRDDRKKERKKPGLKRARRAPQWAKR